MSDSTSNRVLVKSRIAFCVFVFICSIEALYWPIEMEPGTKLQWWQVHSLAELGYFLGCIPLVCILLASGLVPLPILPWLFIVCWTLFLFWLSGLFIKLLSRGKAQNRKEKPKDETA
jgi:hypothetical protein